MWKRLHTGAEFSAFASQRFSVLWLCGSVRYLLSLTQWKQSEQEQNGAGVNHLTPTMQCQHL